MPMYASLWASAQMTSKKVVSIWYNRIYSFFFLHFSLVSCVLDCVINVWFPKMPPPATPFDTTTPHSACRREKTFQRHTIHTNFRCAANTFRNVKTALLFCRSVSPSTYLPFSIAIQLFVSVKPMKTIFAYFSALKIASAFYWYQNVDSLFL